MFNKSQSLKDTILSHFKRSKKKNDSSDHNPYQRDESDSIFVNEISIIIDEFVKTKKQKLQLKPMNSFYRHLVHQLVQDKNLYSASEGSGESRHLVVYKKPISPRKSNISAKKSTERQAKPEAPRKTRAPSSRSGSRSNSKPASTRTRRERSPSSSEKPMGAKQFIVPMKEEGIEVILAKDGFIGIRTNQTDEDIVDSKLIKTGSFLVKNSKIEEVS